MRPTITTRAPARANSSAVARPMPCVAPQTIAVLPSSENGEVVTRRRIAPACRPTTCAERATCQGNFSRRHGGTEVKSSPQDAAQERSISRNEASQGTNCSLHPCLRFNSVRALEPQPTPEKSATSHATPPPCLRASVRESESTQPKLFSRIAMSCAFTVPSPLRSAGPPLPPRIQ